MTEKTKLTIHDLANVEFVGKKPSKDAIDSPASRIIRLSSKNEMQSYAVNMTDAASAKVSLVGSEKSSAVRINGPISALITVISAITATKTKAIKSIALSISGAKPIDG